MAKTEAEIVEAHRTTIEALTGKKCFISLVAREELLLKEKSLDEIKAAVEKIGFASVLSKSQTNETVALRKIFCLLASYGHNNNEVRKYLLISYDQVRYYLRHIHNDLQNDPDLKKQFDRVKSILLGNC